LPSSASATGGAPPHLLHVFPAFAVGGAQSRLVQLLKLFGNRYRHSILALNGCYDMAAQVPAEAPVTCLDGVKDVRGFMAIRRFLAAKAPDVLVTYNWGAIEWAMANRIFPLARHVHIEDGFGPEERERQLARRVWFRRLALSGRHSTIVLPSRTLLDLAASTWRLRQAALRHLVNGIDCTRFAPAPAPAGGAVTIGTVAGLRPEKNLGRLIGAFAAATRARPGLDLRLVLVGDGPDRNVLEAIARRTGLSERIRFAGSSQCPEFHYAQMSIFAMSSDTEQMPLGVLEAMASCLPVVATAVGDIAEMVAVENRPFITPLAEGEAGLARSLLTLAGDAALRAELGRRNRRKALAEFDCRIMAEKYVALFG
jgi:glycosyltransferase involved in cell wall biosynthesis